MRAALDKTGQDDFRVFLTSTDPKVNFRTSIQKSYKMNRAKTCRNCRGTDLTKESYVEVIKTANAEKRARLFICKACNTPVADTKPVYYDELRELLINRYGAWVCEWGEADDWLAVKLGSKDWIATHDKDLYQVDGLNFYNLKSHEVLKSQRKPGKVYMREVQTKNKDGELQFNKNGTPKLRKDLKGYGFKWFCVQMILGDKIDNIAKPSSGNGPVWINKIWNPLTTARECWEMTKLYYRLTGNSEENLWNAAKLIWVARKERQICSEEVINEFIS